MVGTGPIGLTMGQVARAAGARAGHHGRAARRAAGVRRCGSARPTRWSTTPRVASVGEAIADLTDGELCDAVFESVGGTEDTMAQAVEAAAFGGQIGIIGAFWGDVAVAYRAANRKELDLRWCNSYSTWHGVREFQIALDMLAEGRVQAEPLITHRFPLTEIGAAFVGRRRQAGVGRGQGRRSALIVARSSLGLLSAGLVLGPEQAVDGAAVEAAVVFQRVLPPIPSSWKPRRFKQPHRPVVLDDRHRLDPLRFHLLEAEAQDGLHRLVGEPGPSGSAPGRSRGTRGGAGGSSRGGRRARGRDPRRGA